MLSLFLFFICFILCLVILVTKKIHSININYSTNLKKLLQITENIEHNNINIEDELLNQNIDIKFQIIYNINKIIIKAYCDDLLSKLKNLLFKNIDKIDGLEDILNKIPGNDDLEKINKLFDTKDKDIDVFTDNNNQKNNNNDKLIFKKIDLDNQNQFNNSDNFETTQLNVDKLKKLEISNKEIEVISGLSIKELNDSKNEKESNKSISNNLLKNIVNKINDNTKDIYDEFCIKEALSDELIDNYIPNNYKQKIENGTRILVITLIGISFLLLILNIYTQTISNKSYLIGFLKSISNTIIFLALIILIGLSISIKVLSEKYKYKIDEYKIIKNKRLDELGKLKIKNVISPAIICLCVAFFLYRIAFVTIKNVKSKKTTKKTISKTTKKTTSKTTKKTTSKTTKKIKT